MSKTTSNLFHISIHHMSAIIPKGKFLDKSHFLMMLFKKCIRRVVDSEILIDSFALDISVISVEIYNGISEIFYGNTVSAESSDTAVVDLLKARNVFPIEYESFKFIPAVFKENLNPAVKNIVRCIAVNKSRHRAFLELLIYRETVNSARNAACPEQCHEERSLCIALAVPVFKYS